MSKDDQTSIAPTPEETFDDLLTYAELLNTPRLARLYIYVLQYGPAEIEKTDTILAGLAYQYVAEGSSHVTEFVIDRIAERVIANVLSAVGVADRISVVEV